MSRRRVLLIIASFAAVAVGTPVVVLVGVAAGLEPTHWSGVRIADVDPPYGWMTIEAAPEPANVLLGRALDADGTDSGDLAPSWWDADAGEVVLGAAIERGEQARRRLAEGHAVPYRIERRAYSTNELNAVMDAAIDLGRYGVHWTELDPPGNRVIVGTRSLSHDLFRVAGSRFGDAAAIVYAPLDPNTSPAATPAEGPSFWSRTDPPGSWLTLATGFPWYLGAVIVIIGAAWIVPRLARRRRDVPVDASAQTP